MIVKRKKISWLDQKEMRTGTFLKRRELKNSKSKQVRFQVQRSAKVRGSRKVPKLL